MNPRNTFAIFVMLLFFSEAVYGQGEVIFQYLDEQKITLTERQSELLEIIRSRPQTMEVHLINIDKSQIISHRESIRINLPERILRVERGFELTKKGTSWSGSIATLPSSTVLISTDGEDVTGHINTGKIRYSIRPLTDGIQALIKLDPSKFEIEGPPLIPSDSNKIEHDIKKRGKSSNSSIILNNDPVVEVLVAYTSGVESSTGNIRALINEASDLINLSFNNSDVSANTHITAMVELDYEESGDLNLDLCRITTTSSFIPFHCTDTNGLDFDSGELTGHMEDIHQLRNDLNADLVVLLVDSGSPAGAGWVNSSTSYGFSALRYDYISNYTFSHEIGHNIGARHDTASVNINNSPYLYGHGYEFLDPTTLTRTMMATPYTNRVNYWSNPDVNYDGSGPAMGSTQYQDVARVWDERAPTVEAFRSSATPKTLVFNNGYTVDELLTIASGTTVELGDDLIIDSGSELTIQSGVTLDFDPGAEFVINGTLIFGPDATLSGENIEVNSGGNLTVREGATLSFGSGQGITSYGKVLISSGGSPITLEPTGSSWDGVHLYGAGADDSFIYNVTIEDASTGIGVYNTQDVAISITSITGSQNNGVQLSSSDNVIFTEVDIEQSDDAGILVDGGDASIAGGSINLNDMEGVFADGGAYVDGPNSTLLDGNVSATFRLGGSSYMNPHNSSSVNVSSGSYHGLALSTSELDAESNWWDGSPPDAGKFGAFSGSTIDYNPWLFFPPIYPMIAPEHPEQRTKTNPGNDFENPGPVFDEPLFTSAGKLRAYLKQYPPKERMQVMETARNRLPQSQQPWLDILEIEDLQKSGDYKVAEAAAQGLMNNQTLPASLRATAGRRLFIQQLMGQHRYAQARKTLDWITRITPEEDREHLDWMYGLMNTFGREETAPGETCEHCSSSEELSATPLEISNHPNPFNPLTHISYSLPVKTEVSLIVYDLVGREIATLVNETKPAGSHTIPFDASRLSSGIYLYRLVAGNEVTTGRMTLIK